MIFKIYADLNSWKNWRRLNRNTSFVNKRYNISYNRYNNVFKGFKDTKRQERGILDENYTVSLDMTNYKHSSSKES